MTPRTWLKSEPACIAWLSAGLPKGIERISYILPIHTHTHTSWYLCSFGVIALKIWIILTSLRVFILFCCERFGALFKSWLSVRVRRMCITLRCLTHEIVFISCATWTKAFCGYYSCPETAISHSINALPVFPLSNSSLDIYTRRISLTLLLASRTQDNARSKNRIPVRELQGLRWSLAVRSMFQQLCSRELVGTCSLLRLI